VNKRGLPETVRMRHDLHYVEELFQDESGIVGRYLPINSIKPNPDQPRQAFGDLSELVASIKEKGILEPLLVRPREDGFELIAGERRWRACKEVGLDRVPCIIKDVDDREMLEIALIENMQRKDLTPFEEAEGLQTLAEKFAYTHAQIAQVIGKSRTSVTESLSLNAIPQDVRELCRQADISSKSLLLQVVRQPNVEEMHKLIDRISKGQLTRQQVRDREKGERKQYYKPYTYQAKGKGFKLTLRFNRSKVSIEEIREALTNVLDNAK